MDSEHSVQVAEEDVGEVAVAHHGQLRGRRDGR